MPPILITWRKQILSASGFKRVRKALRIRHINGMGCVRRGPGGSRRDPGGSTEPPEPLICFSLLLAGRLDVALRVDLEQLVHALDVPGR